MVRRAASLTAYLRRTRIEPDTRLPAEAAPFLKHICCASWFRRDSSGPPAFGSQRHVAFAAWRHATGYRKPMPAIGEAFLRII